MSDNIDINKITRELHEELLDDAKRFLEVSDPNDEVCCNSVMDRINHHERELSLLDKSLLD